MRANVAKRRREEKDAGIRPEEGVPSEKVELDPRARHDRTVRLLQARLETLARVSERSLGRASFEHDLLRVAAGTRHAVALELLSAQEADEIWAEVARRHPRLARSRGRFGLAA